MQTHYAPVLHRDNHSYITECKYLLKWFKPEINQIWGRQWVHVPSEVPNDVRKERMSRCLERVRRRGRRTKPGWSSSNSSIRNSDRSTTSLTDGRVLLHRGEGANCYVYQVWNFRFNFVYYLMNCISPFIGVFKFLHFVLMLFYLCNKYFETNLLKVSIALKKVFKMLHPLKFSSVWNQMYLTKRNPNMKSYEKC